MYDVQCRRNPRATALLARKGEGKCPRLNGDLQIQSFVAFPAGGLDHSNLCMGLSIRWTDFAAYQCSSVLLVKFKSLSRT